ncbi:MAG TPA: glycoside hydrolase family 28 protein [Polyangiaceae bacterium]|nr:glycoside hydrolase family 28 protein [Polyangiaceae bacterium]
MARLGLAAAGLALGCGSGCGSAGGSGSGSPGDGLQPSPPGAGEAGASAGGGGSDSSGGPEASGATGSGRGEGPSDGLSLDPPGAGAMPGAEPPASSADAALIPFQLEVPTLAFDESSVVLVWHKPENYAGVVDYHVYEDGVLLGSANDNATALSPAKPYIDGFYAADGAGFHVRASVHAFTVTGLEPATEYRFTARSVLPDGTESADSNVVVQRTLERPVVLDVSAAPYAAVGDGTTLNTAAIQAAIDACPPGGKVLVPAGTFQTGALFLKSNMTFELAEGATLLGSARAEDYPLERGYTLYEYLTEPRPPSLLNAIDPARRSVGAFENIRIVGKGIIDGNGWLRTAAGSINDEIGNVLPQYVAGNGNSVPQSGVLAASQVAQALAGGLALDVAYGNRRSSLITLRGVRNAYYAGITVRNPAFHGVMNLETENVVVNGVVHQTYDVNNGDGVEFGNSDNVMVFDSVFDTGDDCINFAAGMGAESSAQPPMQRAWIFDNYFREGHGAVVAGSHTGAWIQQVLAEDNVMFHTDVGLRMKSNVQTGGGGRDFVFRDSAIRDASNNAFIFTLAYGQNDNVYASAPVPAQFRDVLVSRVSVDGADTSIVVDGFDPATAAQNPENYADVFHENIRFQNVALRAVPPATIDHLRDSSFEDVVFSDVVGGASPWVITNSPGLSFLGSTSAP